MSPAARHLLRRSSSIPKNPRFRQGSSRDENRGVENFQKRVRTAFSACMLGRPQRPRPGEVGNLPPRLQRYACLGCKGIEPAFRGGLGMPLGHPASFLLVRSASWTHRPP